MYVKDVASLEGHGRLAFKVQYLITIVYGCFIMTLLYRKLFNTLSLLTIARSQRSYRACNVKRSVNFSVHSFYKSFYKSVPFKIHGYWNESKWSQTYNIQINLWCSQGSRVAAILGMPRGGGALHGKMWTWQYDKISTGTFVLPGPFPIFPCRAPRKGGGGGGGAR